MEENKEIKQLNIENSLEIAEEIVKILDNKKAHNIKLIQVDEKTSIAEYFVLCTATSTTQLKALADEVEYKLQMAGIEGKLEGRDSGWLLIDYGSVIVHVFSIEARDFYKLDKMYEDAKIIDVTKIIKED